MEAVEFEMENAAVENFTEIFSVDHSEIENWLEIFVMDPGHAILNDDKISIVTKHRLRIMIRILSWKILEQQYLPVTIHLYVCLKCNFQNSIQI